MRSFGVVEEFEEAVANFAGAPYGVAVSTGTAGIFLALKWWARQMGGCVVSCPARTFVSVPMAVLQAGYKLRLVDEPWEGVYWLDPVPVVDGALRFRRGMYHGGLHCLSFQARKILPIGEGGMVLTQDREAARWLRKARYWGREGPNFRVEDITEMGWQMYMTPEKAARGLHLMEYVRPDAPDQHNVYPDLREVPLFRPCADTSLLAAA